MKAIALVFFVACSGCSAAALPVLASPVTINVTYNAQDGGAIEDSDVLIDRSSAAADAETTGNVVRDVSPTLEADVSVIPGTQKGARGERKTNDEHHPREGAG